MLRGFPPLSCSLPSVLRSMKELEKKRPESGLPLCFAEHASAVPPRTNERTKSRTSKSLTKARKANLKTIVDSYNPRWATESVPGRVTLVFTKNRVLLAAPDVRRLFGERVLTECALRSRTKRGTASAYAISLIMQCASDVWAAYVEEKGRISLTQTSENGSMESMNIALSIPT